MRHNKMKGVQVFISYRREGGRDIARNIYERLSLAGYTTFFDYNSMQNGEFNRQIYDAIDQADDFVFILSKNALNRCANDGDWVKEEIEYALARKKNIVLLSTEEDVVFPDNLPESLQSLRTRQATFLSQNYYDRSIEMLRNALKSKPTKNNHTLRNILMGAGFSLVVSLVVWLGFSLFASEPSDPMKGYKATIYLMRYDNQRLRYSCNYIDKTLSFFHYEDSVDQQSDMYIYPASDYVDYLSGQTAKLTATNDIRTINVPSHLPTIQLKLHSMNKKTLVLTSAELEVDEYRYDDQPVFRFNLAGQKLEVLNIGAPVIKDGVLEYAILRDGESFTTYKDRQTVTLNPDYASVPLSRIMNPTDSIVGRMVFQDGSFYGFSGRNIQEQQPDVKICSMPIPIFGIKNEKKQSYLFDDFNRSLVKGEIDDEVAFQLQANSNSIYRIRLKLVSSQGNILYSNYLFVRSLGQKHHNKGQQTINIE